MQPDSRWVDLLENYNHPKYQKPQGDQPKEGKTVSLGVEEDETPKEVDDQLRHIEVEPFAALRRWGREPDAGGAHTHEGIQNAPYNGEKNPGRRKWWLLYGLPESGHGIAAEKCGQTANGFGRYNADQIRKPTFFVMGITSK